MSTEVLQLSQEQQLIEANDRIQFIVDYQITAGEFVRYFSDAELTENDYFSCLADFDNAVFQSSLSQFIPQNYSSAKQISQQFNLRYSLMSLYIIQECIIDQLKTQLSETEVLNMDLNEFSDQKYNDYVNNLIDKIGEEFDKSAMILQIQDNKTFDINVNEIIDESVVPEEFVDEFQVLKNQKIQIETFSYISGQNLQNQKETKAKLKEIIQLNRDEAQKIQNEQNKIQQQLKDERQVVIDKLMQEYQTTSQEQIQKLKEELINQKSESQRLESEKNAMIMQQQNQKQQVMENLEAQLEKQKAISNEITEKLNKQIDDLTNQALNQKNTFQLEIDLLQKQKTELSEQIEAIGQEKLKLVDKINSHQNEVYQLKLLQDLELKQLEESKISAEKEKNAIIQQRQKLEQQIEQNNQQNNKEIQNLQQEIKVIQETKNKIEQSIASQQSEIRKEAQERQNELIQKLNEQQLNSEAQLAEMRQQHEKQQKEQIESVIEEQKRLADIELQTLKNQIETIEKSHQNKIENFLKQQELNQSLLSGQQSQLEEALSQLTEKENELLLTNNRIQQAVQKKIITEKKLNSLQQSYEQLQLTSYNQVMKIKDLENEYQVQRKANAELNERIIFLETDNNFKQNILSNQFQGEINVLRQQQQSFKQTQQALLSEIDNYRKSIQETEMEKSTIQGELEILYQQLQFTVHKIELNDQLLDDKLQQQEQVFRKNQKTQQIGELVSSLRTALSLGKSREEELSQQLSNQAIQVNELRQLVVNLQNEISMQVQAVELLKQGFSIEQQTLKQQYIDELAQLNVRQQENINVQGNSLQMEINSQQQKVNELQLLLQNQEEQQQQIVNTMKLSSQQQIEQYQQQAELKLNEIIQQHQLQLDSMNQKLQLSLITTNQLEQGYQEEIRMQQLNQNSLQNDIINLETEIKSLQAEKVNQLELLKILQNSENSQSQAIKRDLEIERQRVQSLQEELLNTTTKLQNVQNNLQNQNKYEIEQLKLQQQDEIAAFEASLIKQEELHQKLLNIGEQNIINSPFQLKDNLKSQLVQSLKTRFAEILNENISFLDNLNLSDLVSLFGTSIDLSLANSVETKNKLIAKLKKKYKTLIDNSQQNSIVVEPETKSMSTNTELFDILAESKNQILEAVQMKPPKQKILYMTQPQSYLFLKPQSKAIETIETQTDILVEQRVETQVQPLIIATQEAIQQQNALISETMPFNVSNAMQVYEMPLIDLLTSSYGLTSSQAQNMIDSHAQESEVLANRQKSAIEKLKIAKNVFTINLANNIKNSNNPSEKTATNQQNIVRGAQNLINNTLNIEDVNRGRDVQNPDDNQEDDFDSYDYSSSYSGFNSSSLLESSLMESGDSSSDQQPMQSDIDLDLCDLICYLWKKYKLMKNKIWETDQLQQTLGFMCKVCREFSKFKQKQKQIILSVRYRY